MSKNINEIVREMHDTEVVFGGAVANIDKYLKSLSAGDLAKAGISKQKIDILIDITKKLQEQSQNLRTLFTSLKEDDKYVAGCLGENHDKIVGSINKYFPLLTQYTAEYESIAQKMIDAKILNVKENVMLPPTSRGNTYKLLFTEVANNSKNVFSLEDSESAKKITSMMDNQLSLANFSLKIEQVKTNIELLSKAPVGGEKSRAEIMAYNELLRIHKEFSDDNTISNTFKDKQLVKIKKQRTQYRDKITVQLNKHHAAMGALLADEENPKLTKIGIRKYTSQKIATNHNEYTQQMAAQNNANPKKVSSKRVESRMRELFAVENSSTLKTYGTVAAASGAIVIGATLFGTAKVAKARKRSNTSKTADAVGHTKSPKKGFFKNVISGKKHLSFKATEKKDRDNKNYKPD